jgi:hypothetical protein
MIHLVEVGWVRLYAQGLDPRVEILTRAGPMRMFLSVECTHVSDLPRGTVQPTIKLWNPGSCLKVSAMSSINVLASSSLAGSIRARPARIHIATFLRTPNSLLPRPRHG